MEEQITKRPDPTKMYGLTHDFQGQPIVREPKTLKVSIGHAQGRALEVYIGEDKKWHIKQGYKKGQIKRLDFDTRKKAEDVFWDAYKNAPSCPYPRKLDYFTFQRLDSGVYVPDFDAIEAHGPKPTEIDIMLINEYPFSPQYALWSASELKCRGDGRNALRVLSMAEGADQQSLAKQAKDQGEKYFPIIDGCMTLGCPLFKAEQCKPHGDLKFQLCSNIRIGGTAFFSTTGKVSISQVHSALWTIRTALGRVTKIPLKMWMKEFNTHNDGKKGTAFGVGLDLRPGNVEALQALMLDQVKDVWAIANPQSVPRQISAPAEEAPIESDDESPMPAEAIAAEFYPDGNEEEPATESEKVADKTKSKTAQLTERLKASSAAKKTEPAPVEEKDAQLDEQLAEKLAENQAAPPAEEPKEAAPVEEQAEERDLRSAFGSKPEQGPINQVTHNEEEYF